MPLARLKNRHRLTTEVKIYVHYKYSSEPTSAPCPGSSRSVISELSGLNSISENLAPNPQQNPFILKILLIFLEKSLSFLAVCFSFHFPERLSEVTRASSSDLKYTGFCINADSQEINLAQEHIVRLALLHFIARPISWGSVNQPYLLQIFP